MFAKRGEKMLADSNYSYTKIVLMLKRGASLCISFTLFITTYSFAGEVVGTVTVTSSNRTQACADAKRKATDEMDLKNKHATANERIFNKREKQPLMQVQDCDCSENMANTVFNYTCDANWSIKYPE